MHGALLEKLEVVRSVKMWQTILHDRREVRNHRPHHRRLEQEAYNLEVQMGER